jgi:hypothetical protein
MNNLIKPYKIINRELCRYTTCKEFTGINRYQKLRQVIHNDDNYSNRYITLETQNPFYTNILTDKSIPRKYIEYEVTETYENRLDLIAQEVLGSPSYAWIIVQCNKIEDAFTVRRGQMLKIPTNVFDLLNTNEFLEPVPVTKLNLGEE